MTNSTAPAKVAEFWSRIDCAASEKNFYSFPPLRARHARLIFGEADAARSDWCEYWTVERYLKARVPVEKCLSICCGFGEVERILARLGVARHIAGTDIAPGAIDAARKRAAEEGLKQIEYFVIDLNTADLPDGEYDLIWANGALHHIEAIRPIIGKLYRALRPGGTLVSNEYVGPKYQQISRRQQELVDAAKHLLPHELRSARWDAGMGFGRTRSLARRIGERLAGEDWTYRQRWQQRGVEWFLATDPSESVSSPEIIPGLQEIFDEVIVRPFAGSLLFYALDECFFENFRPGDKRHRVVLEALFRLEDDLIAAGEFGHDNAHLICRKKM